MSDESTLEDLEIVAGHVWSAVGGAADGEVKVKQVDPKRFGVEVASGTQVTFAVGEEGDTKQVTLATLRPFKPMDLIVVERVLETGDLAVVSVGLTRTRGVDIGGVQQFTSKNPVNNTAFAMVAGSFRPKIRFDTVQTSPNLTADVDFAAGSTIPASKSVTVDMVFGGVAVKR